MLDWFRPFAAVPEASRPMARQLYDDYCALGLVHEMNARAFANLLTHLDPGVLEDFTDEWSEGSAPDESTAWHIRLQIAARLLGVHSDHRFRPADIAAKVSARLPGHPEVVGTREVRGEVYAAGRNRPEWHVTVTLAGEPTVHWRCSSLPGFMDAVNHAIASAGYPGQFIALETDGDYYAFVYGDEAARTRLAASPLLLLMHERDRDPLSGPLEADVA